MEEINTLLKTKPQKEVDIEFQYGLMKDRYEQSRQKANATGILSVIMAMVEEKTKIWTS